MIRIRIAGIVAALLLAVASAGAGAQTPAPASSATPGGLSPLSIVGVASPAPVVGAVHAPTEGMAQLGIYFALVVVLLGGGLFFTRFGFGARLAQGRGDRKLLISETRSLGNRQFLIVAEYENRKMLLGVCPGRIDYLSTLSESDPFSIPERPEKPE